MELSASAVNVVATDGRGGVTVSAMTSVSAAGDLPTLLVCIHHLSAAAFVCNAPGENGEKNNEHDG
ncbi:MAG: hypothetical protein ACR2P5_00635 [Gammaproteobacteria bacterium]